MDNLNIYTPESLKSLLECLGNIDEACFIAGGTDLLIKIRKKASPPKSIISLGGIKELVYINKDNEYIYIGSMTTFTQTAENSIIKQYASCLASAAANVGSKQIRNVATIGGNIANGAPCADSVPPLMALKALVKTINSKGEIKEKPIDAVVKGMEENYLEMDELIIEIKIPLLDASYYSAFGKIGSRSAVAISKLNMAAVVSCSGSNKRIEYVNVALGALGPKAYIGEVINNYLQDKSFTPELIDDLESVLYKQIESIKGRGSYLYKKEAIKGLANNVFYSILEEINGGDINV